VLPAIQDATHHSSPHCIPFVKSRHRLSEQRFVSGFKQHSKLLQPSLLFLARQYNQWSGVLLEARHPSISSHLIFFKVFSLMLTAALADALWGPPVLVILRLRCHARQLSTLHLLCYRGIHAHSVFRRFFVNITCFR
jgi:hypothetical protein